MLKPLFALAALVDFAFGVALILAPGVLLSLYGMSTDRDGTFMARFLGGTLVGFAVLTWLASSWADGKERRQFIAVFFVTTTLGFVVSLWYELQPGTPLLGWIFVVLTGAFAAAFGYLAVGTFRQPGR